MTPTNTSFALNIIEVRFAPGDSSSFYVDGLAEFETLAAGIARGLRAGDVVTLEGELGSGKTTFVAAAVRALGNAAEVASPTFTFWHRYGGSPAVEHIDLYRIDEPGQASELGLDDALTPQCIAFIEWPSRLPGFVPADAIEISIAGSGDGPREIAVRRGRPAPSKARG